MIKVIAVEPDKHPRVERVTNDLTTIQTIVGEDIERIGLDDHTVLVYNEEGKFINLKANRCVDHDITVGTFFIVGGDGGEELISLSEEQIKEHTERFYETEGHTQEEVQRKVRFKFYSY